MKKPLDFNVGSNPHNALLATGDSPMTTPQLSSVFACGLAANSSAVILPQAVRCEAHALEIKKGDSMLNQHRLVI